MRVETRNDAFDLGSQLPQKDDILINLNEGGFIIQAEPEINQLGLNLQTSGICSHVAELSHRYFAPQVRAYSQRVISGAMLPEWIEFPSAGSSLSDSYGQGQWIGLRVQPLSSGDGAIGALRPLSKNLAAIDLKNRHPFGDPSTGLNDRVALRSMIDTRAADPRGGILVLIQIDQLQSIGQEFGSRAVDEILSGFSKFLRAMALPGQFLASLEGKRFAIIQSGSNVDAIHEWCANLFNEFSRLTKSTNSISPNITLSAGISDLHGDGCYAIRAAMHALIFAHAADGDCIIVQKEPRETSANMPPKLKWDLWTVF